MSDTAFLGDLYQRICSELPEVLGDKKRLSLARSAAEYKRAQTLVPGGICGSRQPINFIQNEYPTYLSHGKHGRCWDLDGNEYVDFMLGFGPVALGHAVDEIDEKVAARLKYGFCFTLPQKTQNDLAEKFQEIVPCAQRTLLCKTGTDACVIAVRACRAATGREKVLTTGFHGWADFSQYGADGGVTEAVRQGTVQVPYGDLDGYREQAAKGDVACIMISTMMAGAMLPVMHDPAFLKGLRQVADEYGIPLVFDEIRTGFRYDLDGGMGRLGVIPDIACFSKAMGNGYAIGAVCGKKELMDPLTKEHTWEGTFVTSTYFTNSLEAVAALAVIEYYQKNNVIQALAEKGADYNRRMDEIIARHGAPMRNTGVDCMPAFMFSREEGDEMFARRTITLFAYMIRSGILIHPFRQQYFAYTHTPQDIDRSLEALDKGLGVVRDMYPW